MSRFKDISNQRFGRWSVVSRANSSEKGRAMWVCKCDCGTVKEVMGKTLWNNRSKSCGCYKLEYLKGADNPQTRKALARNGKHMSSNDIWYGRAETIKSACKKKGIPFGFDNVVDFAMYIKEIAPERCPVFNEPLLLKGGGFSPMSPSVDKIIPSKGYVRGNIQVISFLANSMKRDASPKQLIQFAYWVLKQFANRVFNSKHTV